MNDRRVPEMIMLDKCGATVFDSEIGWIGIQWNGRTIIRLRMGFQTRSDLIRQMEIKSGSLESRDESVVALIQKFVSGNRTSLASLIIDDSWMTPFQKRVSESCRNIPWGETVTYGQVAALAGSPGASRAVGSVMAQNRFPLIVPCHRVVSSQGLGGFSAPHGVDLKKRLLDNEGALKTRPLNVRLKA